MEDMATLAVNPGALGQRYNGTVSPAATQNPAPNPAQFAEMEDSAIMLELRAGNMSGFDFLIQKYRKPIVNFMYRMVHNQAVAEELAQEVFLRVYRSRETYRAEARFSTWLYRIATNLGVNYARDTRHERAASTVYLDETDSETGTTPDVADDEPTVEASMLRRERLNAIRQHVLALPERQRMAVLMHKYEGMDYKQIGDVLKLSESATKSLLFRAYQTLREKLKEFI
jgi:RNA polymerase sigma-70 factor, ECF subfamily